MNEILIAWESRHGSTAEISHAIAEVLREQGLQVTLADVTQGVPDQEFDAYILGSGIFHGHWLHRIKQFALDNRQTLLAHPVWLFSTIAPGHEPTPADAPLDIADLYWCTAARQHQMFTGKLDPATLSPAERAMAALRHLPFGDFRDWEAIRAWARHIAASLPDRAKSHAQVGA